MLGLRIERIEELLLIAAVVGMLTRRLKLPYTVGLTLAGIGVALAHISLHVELTRELIFTALLPPLIFEAALQMKWRELRADAGVIAVLATVGIVLAAALVSLGLRYLAHWPWAAAIPLGVLISATDPVSVIATFKEAGVKGRLRLLVESESLLNDGTTAALYTVALAATTGAAVSGGGIAVSFFVTVAGALVCGAVVGGSRHAAGRAYRRSPGGNHAVDDRGLRFLSARAAFRLFRRAGDDDHRPAHGQRHGARLVQRTGARIGRVLLGIRGLRRQFAYLSAHRHATRRPACHRGRRGGGADHCAGAVGPSGGGLRLLRAFCAHETAGHRARISTCLSGAGCAARWRWRWRSASRTTCRNATRPSRSRLPWSRSQFSSRA